MICRFTMSFYFQNVGHELQFLFFSQNILFFGKHFFDEKQICWKQNLNWNNRFKKWTGSSYIIIVDSFGEKKSFFLQCNHHSIKISLFSLFFSFKHFFGCGYFRAMTSFRKLLSSECVFSHVVVDYLIHYLIELDFAIQ